MGVSGEILAAGMGRGLLVGLMPLALLTSVVGMTIPPTALARHLYEGAGFFAQQQAALIALSAGLLLALFLPQHPAP